MIEYLCEIDTNPANKLNLIRPTFRQQINSQQRLLLVVQLLPRVIQHLRSHLQLLIKLYQMTIVHRGMFFTACEYLPIEGFPLDKILAGELYVDVGLF